ncbi:hypothetical protein BJ546DRAFT_22817 [Cryomyces antarcticus]
MVFAARWRRPAETWRREAMVATGAAVVAKAGNDTVQRTRSMPSQRHKSRTQNSCGRCGRASTANPRRNAEENRWSMRLESRRQDRRVQRRCSARAERRWRRKNAGNTSTNDVKRAGTKHAGTGTMQAMCIAGHRMLTLPVLGSPLKLVEGMQAAKRLKFWIGLGNQG